MKKKWIVLLLLPILVSCAKNSRTAPGQLAPGSPEYILNEGVFYLNQGDVEKARNKLHLALKKKPNLKRAHYSLGIVYTYKRDFPNAIKYFNNVLSMDPGSWDAHNFLGLVYTETGQFELAKEHLLKAANAEKYRTPENAYVNLAMLEIKREQYDSALRYVDMGLLKNRTFAPLHNIRGIVLEKQGNLELALYHYNKALSSLTEEDVSILINVGRVHLQMKHKNKALNALEKALGLSKNDAVTKQIQDMIRKVEETE